MSLRSYTIELSGETADYLEDRVRNGHAESVSSAIERELRPIVGGDPSLDPRSDEYRAFLQGAADTYRQLRAGTMTASPLAEVRARLQS